MLSLYRYLMLCITARALSQTDRLDSGGPLVAGLQMLHADISLAPSCEAGTI